MLKHRIAPDVDHDGQLGMRFRDVRKPLVGAYAQENAATHAQCTQIVECVQIRCLIGDQIVRIEIAALLGQPVVQLGEARAG